VIQLGFWVRPRVKPFYFEPALCTIFVTCDQNLTHHVVSRGLYLVSWSRVTKFVLYKEPAQSTVFDVSNPNIWSSIWFRNSYFEPLGFRKSYFEPQTSLKLKILFFCKVQFFNFGLTKNFKNHLKIYI